MRIYDMHIHLGFADMASENVIARMEKAGVYGGCIISEPPHEYDGKQTKSFEERLSHVLEFTKPHKDRLFPVMWIHPHEENIKNKIDIAVEKGIVAFKIICSNFFVYEDSCMEVLKHIAKVGKPVIFHTGILWDGQVSSAYNRPINWEHLINIKGLKFALAHCSWPWYDECIALYGKYLNAKLGGETAEMFLDLTPGTPEIYREDLIKKLFTIGYDFGDNILFGTDCSGEDYSNSWTEKWLKLDNELMDKFSVGKNVRKKLYEDNLMRFLGKTLDNVIHKSPSPDDDNAWNPSGEDTRPVIEYWYKKIGFDSRFDREFYSALNEIEIPDYTSISRYDISCEDGKRNLLSYLYMCEELKNIYEEKGISEDILLDSLKDISVWTNIWSEVKGELYLGELPWLKNHLTPILFKLGRLQFCMGILGEDIEKYNLRKGDSVVEIHIPERGPLNYEECVISIDKAREFFKKYYPEYDYKCFTCDSWLLGSTPEKLLSPESNIVRFINMFEIIRRKPDDSILRYLFKWNTTRENISDFEAKSSFAKEVKKRAMAGEQFDEGLGIIQK